MADPKHLTIIKQGVEVWNDWRLEHPLEEIDLSDVDLHETNLVGAYLCRTNFTKANLRRANLFRADLYRADLSNACLSETYFRESDTHGTDFSGADLYKANFSGADLQYCDFSSADLTRTNLYRANLRYSNISMANLTNANLNSVDLSFTNLAGADLSEADLNNTLLAYTIFGDTNLRDVKNLELCYHKSPSIIDQMTLIKSGQLPEIFLRGCGLSSDFIQYIPSLFWSAKAMEFFSCFISYSHKDKLFAQRLHDALQKQGIRCWLDEKQLRIGDEIYTEVDRGIRLWDKVLLCCSKHSLEKSWWVDNEIITAFKKEQKLFKKYGKKVIVLVPLNLDGYMFTDDWQSGKKEQILSRLAANFIGWKKNNNRFELELEKVVNALRVDAKERERPPDPKL